MFAKQRFDTNIYMKLFRWAYILLMGTLCFSLVNLPFFFATISLAIDVRNVLFFALSLLFVGPGFVALFGMIDVFKEHKDVEPVKEFLRKYRQFGLRGFLYGLIGWGASVVCLADVYVFAKLPGGQWLIPLFLILMIIGLAVSINAWYYQVRNPQATMKDVLRLAFYMALKKWYASLLNLVLFAAIFAVMLLKPQFGFVITTSLFAGIMYLNLSFAGGRKE